MRIVIDLQGAQGESRFRGLGRFSLWFAKALVENNTEHDIHLALNGYFQDSIDDIRHQFESLLPQTNIHVWYSLANTAYILDNHGKREISEEIYKGFIKSLNPDVLIIASFFEGYSDASVFSIDEKRDYQTFVVLYDIIPHLFQDIYFENKTYEKFYKKQLENFKKNDFFLSISQASLDDAEKYLGLKDNIFNIGCSTIGDFSKKQIKNEKSILKKFGIEKPFLLSTMTNDTRKNFEGLLEAFLSSTISLDHQLVLVTHLEENKKTILKNLLDKYKHVPESIIITNYINDEMLLGLYNLCKASIFPSHYEGFGLPVLEAMACGKAVICSNNSSLPEIVNNEDALFDSKDIESMRLKIEQVLNDDNFRKYLEEKGYERSKDFSWDLVAKKTLDFIETKQKSKKESQIDIFENISKIFIQNKFGENLLIETSSCITKSLKKNKKTTIFYDISELFLIDQKTGIQRVVRSLMDKLYYYGYKSFNFFPIYYEWSTGSKQQVYKYTKKYNTDIDENLDNEIADFYSGDIFLGIDLFNLIRHEKQFFLHLKNQGVKIVFFVYDLLPIKIPGYFGSSTPFIHWLETISEVSDQIICISKSVEDDLKNWILENDIERRRPLEIKHINLGSDVENSLPTTGIPEDAYPIFNQLKYNINFLMVGTVEPRKGHRQTLKAFDDLWGEGLDVNLVIVGKQGWQMEDFVELLNTHPERNKRLFWLSGISDEYLEKIYSHSTCLIAASEGEGYGLPIVEAAKHSLPIIARDIPVFREVSQNHAFFFDGLDSLDISSKMREWIDLYKNNQHPLSKDIKLITWKESAEQVLDIILSDQKRKKRIYLDLSQVYYFDPKTGIQRVVRGIYNEFMIYKLHNFEFVPIAFSDDISDYIYAWDYSDIQFSYFIKKETGKVSFEEGDIFFGLDFAAHIVPYYENIFESLTQKGVKVSFILYDLLCVRFSNWFSEDGVYHIKNWLNSVLNLSDQIICISKSVEDDLKNWILENDIERRRPLEIKHINLGSDVENSLPTTGIPEDAYPIFNQLKDKINFLMVGTVEPRKGHRQTLKAFDDLWAEGLDVNLVIVGKQGWKMEDFIDLLNTHPERNKRLFWLSGISDEYLEKIYAHSTCLIAASEGEGYGLPIVEAAKHSLPIIARDIPVFREVSQNHAFFFDGLDSLDLSSKIREWIDLYKNNQHPLSKDIKLITWKESAEQVLDIILGKDESSKKSQIIRFDQKDDDSPFTGEIDFSKSKIKNLQKVEGLSNNEEWGRWSDANLHESIVLNFKKQLPNQFNLTITGITFGDNAGSDMPIKINDKTYILRLEYEIEKTIFVDLDDDIGYSIEFFPPRPQYPGNGDMRKIAVGLKRIKIKEVKD